MLEINGRASGGGPVANPTDYAEMEFEADAGKEYYIWTRGKALSTSNVTDATWIQFDNERLPRIESRIKSTRRKQ